MRVITDDEKAADLGSDAANLRAKGIPVRTDKSKAHMHHKYVIFVNMSVCVCEYFCACE